MSPLFIKISKDFATHRMTIDPIGNVAIFAGLTASLSRAERRRTALRACSLMLRAFLVVAVVAGQFILDAGLAFTCTRSKLQADDPFPVRFADALRTTGCAKPGRPSLAATWLSLPLAVPSIAGPGAMMAVIPLLTDNDVYTVAEQAETGVVLLAVLLLTYILLLFRRHPADHRPSGSGRSCPCHGDHSCLTRGGNRADGIGSRKLGTRFALRVC